MSTRWSRTLTAVSLALALGGEVVAQQGVIAGRVTDATTLDAVVGARIRVVGGGGPTEVISRTDGTFELQLAAGTYDLVVEADGFLPAPFHRLRVFPGQVLNQNLPLQSQGYLLDGFIVTARRLPESSRSFDTELTAPSASHSIDARDVLERPTPNPVDHARQAPGVDIGTLGLQSSNVVVRGFNNIFSGALNLMTDYRLSGLPGLRVNYAHFLPLTAYDVERVEVVSGAGSALYGPNTANGVLHVITRSPFDDPGTRVSLAAGEQSAFQGTFRTGLVVGDELALKLSGGFLRGREWTYFDPAEGAARDSAVADPGACIDDRVVRGLDEAAAAEACGRIGDRDFDTHRYGLEARADWRFSGRGSFIATYGVTDVSGIELTPLSAAQVDTWRNQFVQGRFYYDRWAIQAYLNFSDSGDVFLLRDGVDLIDRSTLGVIQIQNGFSFADDRQDLTYGFDYFSTRPESRRTIYGDFESDNDISEWGLYLQSKTALTSRLDLFVAGRIDAHSVLPDKVFSPRLALVFQPKDNHAFRASYNRAFSTPTALNHFLDLGAGFVPENRDLFGLNRFSSRASGTGRSGFSWRNPSGGYWMRSPYNRPGGPGELLTVDRATLWRLGLEAYGGRLPEHIMATLGRVDPEDVGIQFFLPVANPDFLPLDSIVALDVDPIKETTSETFEVGWTGVFAEALRVSVDGYYRRQFDFVSPLTVASPLFRVNVADLGQAYLSLRIPELVESGSSPEEAAEIALGEFGMVGPVAGATPLATAVSDLHGQRSGGADIITTYRNIDEVIDVWGLDASLHWILSPRWTLSATYSHVSRDEFEVEGGVPLALNAPTDKGTLGVAYRDEVRGWNASARVRYTDAFPFRATEFEGQIDAYALVDLTAGYRIPRSAATVQVGVSNVLDEAYQSFIGAPAVGRMAMLRITYEF